MNQTLMNDLVEAAAELEIEMRGRDDYSGRMMYGKKTNAVDYDHPSDLLRAVARVAANRVSKTNGTSVIVHKTMEQLDGEVSRLAFDDMGRGQIAY